MLSAVTLTFPPDISHCMTVDASRHQVVPPNLLKVKADADKNAARLGSLACFGHDFDWGASAERPATPLDDSVVLEVHVPTFTANLVSGRPSLLPASIDPHTSLFNARETQPARMLKSPTS